MTRERNDIMVTCRIPREDVAYIDELAAAAGCSRSEYIRRVLKLPVAMQTESAATLRTSRGDRRIGASANGINSQRVENTGNGNATPVSDSECAQVPRAVLLLTDVPIRKLCVAIDRWGTNYNQAVRALNAIAKRFTDMPVVNRDDANDILYFLQVCAQGNELAKQGIDSVAEEAQRLLGVAVVDMRDDKSRRPRTATSKRSKKSSKASPATHESASQSHRASFNATEGQSADERHGE